MKRLESDGLPPPTDDVLRDIPQPSRELVKHLRQLFAAGKLAPGGKVIMLRGKK